MPHQQTQYPITQESFTQSEFKQGDLIQFLKRVEAPISEMLMENLLWTLDVDESIPELEISETKLYPTLFCADFYKSEFLIGLMYLHPEIWCTHETKILNHVTCVTCIAIDKQVAIGTYSGDIYLDQKQSNHHKLQVTSLKFANSLYSCSLDGQVCQWSQNLELLNVFNFELKPNLGHGLKCICPSNVCLVGTESGKIYHFDLSFKCSPFQYRGLVGPVKSLEMSPFANVFVAAGNVLNIYKTFCECPITINIPCLGASWSKQHPLILFLALEDEFVVFDIALFKVKYRIKQRCFGLLLPHKNEQKCSVGVYWNTEYAMQTIKIPSMISNIDKDSEILRNLLK